MVKKQETLSKVDQLGPRGINISGIMAVTIRSKLKVKKQIKPGYFQGMNETRAIKQGSLIFLNL